MFWSAAKFTYIISKDKTCEEQMDTCTWNKLKTLQQSASQQSDTLKDVFSFPFFSCLFLFLNPIHLKCMGLQTGFVHISPPLFISQTQIF